MKKLSAALCLTFLLTACGPSSESASTSSSTPNKTNNDTPNITIGMSISSIATNPFFQNMYRRFEQIDRDNPQLTIALASADNDQEKQNRQLEQMVANGSQALIINLANVGDGPAILQHWCAKNIPLIFINRSPGDKNLAACPKAYFVDADTAQAGVFQAEQILRQWHSNPAWDKNRDGIIQYAMLQGLPNHEGTAHRSKWVISTINTYPQIGVKSQSIFEEYASFQSTKAEEITSAWLNKPEFAQVEIIIANNDTMALGALNALKARGQKLPIFGIDGSLAGLQAVQTGDMAGTVFNDFQAQADAAVQIAANLAAGKEATQDLNLLLQYKTIVIPVRQIDRNNLQDFIKLYH